MWGSFTLTSLNWQICAKPPVMSLLRVYYVSRKSMGPRPPRTSPAELCCPSWDHYPHTTWSTQAVVSPSLAVLKNKILTGFRRPRMEKKWSKGHSVTSDSLRPTAWNSPGQNTGVGSLPFSRVSSQPRDQTQISHVAGRFFTRWATREAHVSVYISIRLPC